ncbi:hypothetical protein CRG98_047687 [Punica granatum]|uniref:Beta-galactosidase galactose-binding domain-containing protein n=1 Tax=Punica granatum TaxID=22663 RepID=A0A2I0HJP9_PUNGR|nr:hypothetical protein CRG98_047687 [Punica granatum]
MPLALDMGSTGKGQIWINGQSIGRYWPAYKASGSCGRCDYAGTYGEKKCLSNCGEASQRWYHVPRSWLNPTGNLLVVFEEWGGDPNGISLVRRDIDSVFVQTFRWRLKFKFDFNLTLIVILRSIWSNLRAHIHLRIL